MYQISQFPASSMVEVLGCFYVAEGRKVADMLREVGQ